MLIFIIDNFPAQVSIKAGHISLGENLITGFINLYYLCRFNLVQSPPPPPPPTCNKLLSKLLFFILGANFALYATCLCASIDKNRPSPFVYLCPRNIGSSQLSDLARQIDFCNVTNLCRLFNVKDF